MPPETSDREISADLSGKDRKGERKKGKMGTKEGKLKKGSWKIEKLKRWKEKLQMRRGFFFLFTFKNH